MAKLHTTENIVLDVLEKSEAARKDDYILMWLVCEKVKPTICEQRFADVLYNHKEIGLPNWETVTRCRRKIQEKRPDLANKKTAQNRKKEEAEYIEYSRT